MAILSTALWRVNPGRGADFMQAAAEAKKIHERLGARTFLMQWSNNGASSGVMGYGLLFPDLVAWGKFSDASVTDQANNAFLQQHVASANASATLLSQTVANDLPGFEATDPASPGTVVLAVSSALTPGKTTADAVALLTRWKPVALEFGAQWARARRVMLGGESSLRITVTVGFPNAAAYADWQLRFSGEQTGQELQAAVYGAGSPFTNFAHATGRVLPN